MSRSYTAQTSSYTSPSQAVEDSKKRTSLLKDNSWIKKAEEEDEAVDRDPNFGKTVLGGRYTRTTETVTSSQPVSKRTSTSSVQALTKRFSTSQDELYDSTSPTKTYSRTSLSSVTSPTRSSVFLDDPETSSTTTTVTENGKTTVTTTTQKSSSKTDSFMERVFSDRTKGTTYSSYSPTRKTTVTETITTSSSNNAEDKLFSTLLNDPPMDTTDSKTSVTKTETVLVKSSGDSVEDDLYDTLIPSSIKDESKTITTEIVTIKSSSSEPDDSKTSTTTRTSTSSMAEDQLYDTLIPKAIADQSSSSSITKRDIYTVSSSGGDSPTLSSTTRTSSYSSYTDEYPSSRTSTYTISTKTSDDLDSDSKTYSYSKPDSSYEYTSITSPSSYTSTTYKTTRSDDIVGDTYSRSSVKSVYASPERTVLEKDLCSSCRKPFTGDAKIILDDMKINCHASCFKCEVCNSTLGHLKAGDSMWIYKHMVHCERCFEVTRDKWRR